MCDVIALKLEGEEEEHHCGATALPDGPFDSLILRFIVSHTSEENKYPPHHPNSSSIVLTKTTTAAVVKTRLPTAV